MPDIVKNVSREYAFSKVDAEYPHIFLEDVEEAVLPILVTCLEPGTVPLYIKYKGTVHCLDKRISYSPLTLAKILKIHSFILNKSPSEAIVVHNNVELLELGVWWEAK